MKKTRRFLGIMMAAAMVCGMAGCAAPAKETTSAGTPAAETTAAETKAEAEAKTEAAASETGAESTGEKLLVGVLVYNDKNEYIQKLLAGAKEKCDEYGYDMVSYSADKDTAKEVTNMEDVLSLKPGVIIYNPVDSDAAEATVSLANAAGVPVITVDREANGGDIAAHIASDNVYGGELAGKYVEELLGDNGGQVVEIQGQAGTSAARDRGEGFHNIVDKNSKIEVVASQIGNWDKAEAMAIMENSLQAYPDVKAVFAHSDQMALGAMEACNNAGKKDIYIVGFDADDDAVAAVKNGDMAATIEQLPTLMGEKGIEIAHEFLSGNAPDKYQTVEVNLITTKD